MTNIYLELDLHLDPPITDSGALKAELNRKIAEWNKMVVSNPKFANKVTRARKYVSDGMPNSQIEATAARNQRLNELGAAVQEQLMMGKITERGFTRLCELFPCFSGATIKNESGYVPEQLFKPPVVPPSLNCNRVIPAIEMESIRTDLLAVENGTHENLYSLLGGTPATPRKTLHAKADEELEKNRRVAAKNTEINAKGRLYGKALNYFKDDYGQLDYDAALTRQTFEQICRKQLQHRAINGIITMAIYKKSVADARALGLTESEAEWLVYEYYCEKMKCPPPIMVESGTSVNKSPGANWIADIIGAAKDLIWAIKTSPPKQPVPMPASAQPVRTPDRSVDSVSQRGIIVEEPTILLETFRVGDVKSTINPFDQYTLETVIKDKVFWQASALCALPMLIVSLDNDKAQLSNLLIPLFWLLCCVGFLYVVGRMFQRHILRRAESIRLPIVAFFGTLFVGVPLMLFIGGKFLSMSFENPTSSLIYGIITGGFLEEACKILPVMIYLLYCRGKTSLKMAVTIGVLSSVGMFAGQILLAIEWIQGFLFPVMKNWLPHFQKATNDLFSGSSDDIFVHAFPLFSFLIAHAVWTAIFTYYLFCAVRAGSKGFPFALIGLAVATLFHVIYVSLCHNNLEGIAAFVVAGSFVLFYGYLTQVRRQIVQPV